MNRILLTILIILLSTVGSSLENVTYKIDDKYSYNDQQVIDFKYETIYSNIIGTVYHPERRQTDRTPLLTADHSHINPDSINEHRWVALSRDLINYKGYGINNDNRDWDGLICFGDTILIESPKNKKGKSLYPEIEGLWIVHDTMNKRYKNRIDFLQSKDGLYGKWYGLIIKKKTYFFIDT